MSAQTEAALVAALTDHLVDEDILRDGEFVGDWIANVYLPSMNEQDGHGYALVMSGGELPDHVAVGLLTNALDRVRGLGVFGDDE